MYNITHLNIPKNCPAKWVHYINADATQILLLYRSRWAIESIFRDLKQELNLGSCQSVSLDAQKSHLALSIFAFVLMELIPVLEFQGKKYQTIGEKKRLLSRLSLFTNLSKTRYWLIDNSQPGSSFLALDQLKLDKVELSFGFAYKTLLFSNFQRSA
ncbi:MAG: transposase [Candidatus Brocadiae bacterium]|nr:transposase [Candidatus Brocadiia bacterium]